MLAGMLAFLCAVTFKILSSFGARSGDCLTAFPREGVRSGYTRACVFAGVFQQSTEEVILKFVTPVTPAPWALFFWDYTYLWIFAMFVYLIVGLCRRLLNHFNTLILHHRDILSSFSDFTQLFPHRLMYFPPANLTVLSLLSTETCSPGCTPALQWYHTDSTSPLSSIFAWTSHGHFCLTESECKELKPEKSDRLCHTPRLNCVVCRLLLAALIISGLMTLTDYMVLFFSCQGLKVYGAWLSKNHNLDLWLIRILVKQMVLTAVKQF